MKNFVVARHGSYDSDLNLNTKGEVQIKQLAKVLKQVMNDGSILLLSSSTTRAVQSSQILSSELGVPFESLGELRSIARNPEGVGRALELILSKSKGFDYVIIMTHCEYAELLPSAFAKKELRRSDFYFYAPAKGEAWCINCKEKIYKCIP